MTASRLCAMLGAAALIAGCGGSGATDTAADSGAAPTKAEFTVTEDAKQASIDGPKEIAGGPVEISYTNDTQEPQSLQLLAPTGDYTAEETLAALAKIVEGQPAPDWFHAAGGIGTTAPGTSATVTQSLEPGHYIALSEEQQGDVEDAPWFEFDVTDGSAGEIADADATVTARDFTFDTAGLKAGENNVQFSNEGQQWHHMQAFPLNEGVAFEDAQKFFATEGEPKGPPPFDEKGIVGTAVMDPGMKQDLTMNLNPGKYALVCFISNREGGPPHVAMGMIKELDVQ